VTDFSRYLSIDHGEKYIGLALSDPLKITARALKILDNNKHALVEITSIVATHDVSRVIVGLPTNADSRVGPQAEIVIDWTKKLSEHISVPIVFWDETYSSVEAAQYAARRKRKNQRARIDDIAAANILQDYLAASEGAEHEPGKPLESFQ